MIKLKFKKWRGRGLALAMTMAFLVSFFAITADARIAIITGNGNIRLTPNSVDKVKAGTGTFTDSNGGSFSDANQPADRTIASGFLSAPGTVFWSGSDTKSGVLSLLLRATDVNVPDGGGTVVTRYRNASVSQGYDDKGNPITNFLIDTALSNIEDSPPPASGQATHIGFDLRMNPIVYTTLEVVDRDKWVGDYASKYYAISSYHYKVTQDTTNSLVGEGDVAPNNGNKAEFNLDSSIFTGWASGKYWITPTAKNGYTSFSIPARDGEPFSFTFTAGGGPQTYPITFESQASSNKPGFNFFSMPILSDKDSKWYAYKADGTTFIASVSNAYELIKVINKEEGPGKYVSTFGAWDKTNQNDQGILIPSNDPDGSAKASLMAMDLMSGVGYQVYIGKDPITSSAPKDKVTIIIKNTP